MFKRILIQSIILLLPVQWIYSQEVTRDERLRSVVRTEGQAEVMVPAGSRLEKEKLYRLYSVRRISEKAVHILLSPVTVEEFIAGNHDYIISEGREHKGMTGAATMKEAMEWESYPSYTQYDSIMSHFSSAYPELCRLDTIGTSINGKLVMAIKISDNCPTDEAEPEVFFTSSMHGDETGGFILMLRLADYLLKNYNTVGRVRNLADNLEIWINPLANPDGMYRNGNDLVSPVRFNAAGYDLNRNFPDPEETGTVRQKETADMMRFLEERRFVLSANFHSGEEVVNYPWDRWSYDHADNDWFYNISRAYADTVHKYSPPGYMDYLNNGITRGYDWYPVNGGRQDYVTYYLGGREVSVELDEDFITPVSDLDDLWQYNYRSLLGYLENALYGIHGSVTDSDSGDPVPARIFIRDHDKDSSHVYADTLNGSFTRFLAGGSYDIEVSALRYRDTTLTGIDVINGEKTGLLIKISPDLNPADTTDPAQPLFYPNPGNSLIKVVLPEILRGEVNVRIFDTTGKIQKEFVTPVPARFPLELDLGDLNPGTYYIEFTNRSEDLRSSGKVLIIR